MAPLTREQYEPLFAKIPLYESSTAVRSFVADVNGHPRTLMAVLDVLLSQKTFAKPIRSSLLSALDSKVGFNSFDFNVPADVIIKALLKQQVHLKNETAPGKLSYSYYVTMVRMARFYSNITHYALAFFSEIHNSHCFI